MLEAPGLFIEIAQGKQQRERRVGADKDNERCPEAWFHVLCTLSEGVGQEQSNPSSKVRSSKFKVRSSKFEAQFGFAIKADRWSLNASRCEAKTSPAGSRRKRRLAGRCELPVARKPLSLGSQNRQRWFIRYAPADEKTNQQGQSWHGRPGDEQRRHRQRETHMKDPTGQRPSGQYRQDNGGQGGQQTEREIFHRENPRDLAARSPQRPQQHAFLNALVAARDQHTRQHEQT